MDIKTITVVAMVIASALMSVPFWIAPDAAALGPETDSAQSDSSIIGPAADNQLGYSVSIVGDVDGDGLDDMLIGTPFVPPGMGSGARVGRAYLYLGNTTGLGNNTYTSQAKSEFIGQNPFDLAGLTVAGAGDVDGDGLGDMLIGAPNAGNGGRVYLVLGNRTNLGRFVSLSNVFAYYEGGAASMELGTAMASGDLNGDGFSDLVLGAPTGNAVFVVFGNSTGMKKNITLNSNADAKYTDPTNSQSLGKSLAVGDLDGDAIGDIIMGAPFYDARYSNDGAVFVVFGGKAKTWPAGGASLPGGSDAWLRGDALADNFGTTVTAGDMDGNSSMELVVGAPGWDHGVDADSGMTYIFNGTDRVNWTKGMWAENTTLGYWGVDGNDQAPSSIAMGDVNGDGLCDLAVGAYRNDSLRGRVHIIQGSAPLPYGNRSLDTAHHWFMGEAVDDRLGWSVSLGGDVNGDAYADVFMGAPRHANASALNSGKAYLFTRENNSAPGAGTGKSITIFADPAYSMDARAVPVGGTIYLEVNATDANASTTDSTKAYVTSSVTDTDGITVLLKETGVNTGIYRGKAEVRDHSFEPYRWIGATEGETITVSTVCICGFDTVYVGSDPAITPDNTSVNGDAFEDMFYTQKFDFLRAQTVTWTFETNATNWLKWNATNSTLYGLPDNSDVGVHWVNLTVRDTLFKAASVNFTMRVHNTAPRISTVDNLTAMEDIPYYIDYNSSDDGQGTITWRLLTGHAWLHIDANTGLLNGTPGDVDIGTRTVEVSVDDGNGGFDVHNFTLTVGNVNDPPVILTKDVLYADEDVAYSVQYTALDPDPGDVLEWRMVTNATWLSFVSDNVLMGTPQNDNVGRYWVNVSVEDPMGLVDHHNFTLTANNTNDPPIITTIPKGVAKAGEVYTYDSDATDVDVGAVITWSLAQGPSGMTVDHVTGNVTWTPTDAQVGIADVDLSVSDGVANDSQQWTIDVKARPVNDAPVAKLLAPANGSQVQWPGPSLQWNGSDADGDVVKYGLYLSKNKDLVEARSISALVDNDTVMRTYTYTSVAPLDEDSMYYWTVVPYDGKVRGTCQSGIWSFEVGAGTTQNHPPSFSDEIPEQNVTLGGTLTVALRPYVMETDIGDMLTFSFVGVTPEGMTIDSVTGVLTWTPPSTGTYTVTIAVSDGKASAQGSIVIKVSESGGGGDGDDGKDGQGGMDMLMMFGIIMIIALVIVGLSLVATRGRKQKEEEYGPVDEKVKPSSSTGEDEEEEEEEKEEADDEVEKEDEEKGWEDEEEEQEEGSKETDTGKDGAEKREEEGEDDDDEGMEEMEVESEVIEDRHLGKD